jgi:tetratricopeptide (TPR) repeat protein
MEASRSAAYLNDRSYLAFVQKDYAHALQLVDEAMALRRGLGLHEGDVLLFNAGLALLELDRINEAKNAYRRGLERAVAIGDRSGFCIGLAGIVCLRARGPARTSRAPSGRCRKVHRRNRFRPDRPEFDALERLRGSLERQLGSRLAGLLAECRTMDVEAAVADVIAAAG